MKAIPAYLRIGQNNAHRSGCNMNLVLGVKWSFIHWIKSAINKAVILSVVATAPITLILGEN